MMRILCTALAVALIQIIYLGSASDALADVETFISVSPSSGCPGDPIEISGEVRNLPPWFHDYYVNLILGQSCDFPFSEYGGYMLRCDVSIPIEHPRFTPEEPAGIWSFATKIPDAPPGDYEILDQPDTLVQFARAPLEVTDCSVVSDAYQVLPASDVGGVAIDRLPDTGISLFLPAAALLTAGAAFFLKRRS